MRLTTACALALILSACKSSDASTGTKGDDSSGTAEAGADSSGSTDAADAADASSTASGTASGSSGSGGGTAEGGSSTTAAPTTSASGTGFETDTDTDSAGSAGTAGTAGGIQGCGGTVYACGDGIDNDGDGKVDTADPECVSPCDDDESSFRTGLPGDNRDCKQDCFFDGNSGQGDDKCVWDLRCDPSNPGAGTTCEYNGGGGGCAGGPQAPTQCLDACLPNTPNGCDCFGCCTIETNMGDVHVFLGSGADCALDSLENCTTCTPQMDCINDCKPEDCEVCFGEEELPDGCMEANCPEWSMPCTDSSECPDQWYCGGGCCLIIPG